MTIKKIFSIFQLERLFYFMQLHVKFRSVATCLNKAVLPHRIIDSSVHASTTIKGHTGAVVCSQQTGSESWNFLSGSLSVRFLFIIFNLLYSLSRRPWFSPFIWALFLCQNSAATCGWKVLKLWKQSQDLVWFTRFPQIPPPPPVPIWFRIQLSFVSPTFRPRPLTCIPECCLDHH